jgi:hypothetical protein
MFLFWKSVNHRNMKLFWREKKNMPVLENILIAKPSSCSLGLVASHWLQSNALSLGLGISI